MFVYCQLAYRWVSFLIWLYRRYEHIKTEESYASELREQLEQLGILGIKLGQYLCNRPDICTDIMREELSVFLNDNKTHDHSYSRQLLDQAGFGHVVLGDILGSGSLAQVYQCTLPNEAEPLVVKINHPEVAILPTEITVLRHVIRALGCMPNCRVVLHMDWEDFFDMIHQQINMENEAANMKQYYDIYHGHMDEITTPRFIAGTTDFIIMTYCQGKPLHMFDKTDERYRRAHNLFVTSYIHTGIAYQFMHGDIHTGNILVRDDGSISIIDFGLCLRLEMEQFIGIMAISKFESNPTLENCEDLVLALIHPHDVEHRPIDIAMLTREFYHDYMNGYKDNVTKTISGVLELIVSLLRKYNVILHGTILSYFLNTILLEGLSPYHEKQQLSSIIAVSFIKKHPFLQKEAPDRIEKYYQTILSKTLPELIEKYNL